MEVMSEESEEWDCYVVVDGSGASHVVRRPRGRLPQIRCKGTEGLEDDVAPATGISATMLNAVSRRARTSPGFPLT